MTEERVNYKLLFPSKYLKAADLRERDVTVTIYRLVQRAKLEVKNGKNQQRPIAYFEETKRAADRDGSEEKGMILNVTNCNTIARMYGPYPVDWVGKRITLYPTRAQMGGEEVDAIRVRPVPPPPVAAQPQPTEESK